MRNESTAGQVSNAFLIPVCVLFGLLLIAFVVWLVSESPKVAREPLYKTVRATYWCGETLDDGMSVAVAVSREDALAVAGLVSRGSAFQVVGGTPVLNGGPVAFGISLVHIDSGPQMGRKCYISTRALE